MQSGASASHIFNVEDGFRQRQHGFLVYNENSACTWPYEKLLGAIRAIVCENEIYSPNFFGSLGTQSMMRPQEFEVIPTQRDWDWLQYNLEPDGGFMRQILESKNGTAIYWHFCQVKQTTVRAIAMRMGKYDSDVKSWTDKLVKHNILIPGESHNYKERPLRLNMYFKFLHTVFQDLASERYLQQDLHSLFLKGAASSGYSKNREKTRARVKKHREKKRQVRRSS